MRIVCLVKNNQPLVRELSDVCQIILTYTSIDNASHAYWFLSRNVTDIVCILVQFFTKSQELLWLERALRPSSPAQCGYNQSGLFSALSTWRLNVWQMFLSNIMKMQTGLRAIPLAKIGRKEGETLKGSLEIICACKWKTLYSLTNLFQKKVALISEIEKISYSHSMRLFQYDGS